MITLLFALFEGLDDHITVDDNSVGFLEGLLGGISLLLEIFVCFEVDNTDLLSNGGGCWGLITCDHDDFNTG